MMRYMMIMVALMLGTSATFAQDTTAHKKGRTPEQRAEHYTRWMSKELVLSADQQTKVKAVNLETAKKMEEAKSANYKSGKEKQEKVKAIQDERDKKLKPILTSEQWNKYTKAKEAKKAKMKEKQKNKKAGKGKPGDADPDDLDD